jgi:3-deoxy-D-manno-octulosonic-acid transferase
MNRLWHLLYNAVGLTLLWLVLHVLALVKTKVRRGIAGRRGLFEQLARDVAKLSGRRRIWFHSSSMGEFEQAKPIISALRERYADISIIVTFFSPSGYEHSRSYRLASLISYLPFDSAANARRFLDLVRPDVAVMVRYDIWPNHVWELHRRNIPILIANATLRTSSSRFLPVLRNFHRYLYNHLTAIFTVSRQDAETFRRFNLSHPRIEVIGETRYDQVWQRSVEARTKHLIPHDVLRRRKVFVVGSSWEEDEAVVLPAFRKIAQHDSGALMILVPHEPTIETLERLEIQLNGSLRPIRFSELNDYSNENVILVDSIGVLMALYQYAHVAYVGGSFKQGIHNVLEPAVYGVPVLFGPKHENSREAILLTQHGGAFVVQNSDDCFRRLRTLWNNKEARARAGRASLALVQENTGATERFIKLLAPYLD